MSTIASALTTWEEFLRLPDDEDDSRFELQDGEVVARMPPAQAVHVFIQHLLTDWLTDAAQGSGSAMAEFPYRPASNLQFWYADVAYVPKEDWQAMRSKDYPVYSPPLIVEVLSPSNRKAKIERQRIVAFSYGSQAFWVVDPVRRTIEVSLPGEPSRIYGITESVPVNVLPGAILPVASVFPE